MISIKDIYGDFLRTIKQTNPERDLNNWSKENGTGMGMNWPVFEVKFMLLLSFKKIIISKINRNIQKN